MTHTKRFGLLGIEFWTEHDSSWGRALIVSLCFHMALGAGIGELLYLRQLAQKNRPKILEVTLIDPIPEPPAPMQVKEKTISAPPPKNLAKDLTQLLASQKPLLSSRAALKETSAALPQQAARPSATSAPALVDKATPLKTPLLSGPVGGGASPFGGPALQEAKAPLPPAGSLSGWGGGTAAGSGTSSARGAANPSDLPAGFDIEGEIASRKVVKSVTPPYPEWAQRQGIQAVVSLRITVLGDGRVKSNIMVERTSGYRALDQVAIESLRQWEFETLPVTAWKEQWGIVNFVFRLEGAI